MAQVDMSRLFVAVWPPTDVVEAMTDIDQPKDQGVRWVPMENRHVTLHFLGEADPPDVIAALDRVDLPAATARLGPAFDALAEHSLVVPVGGLDELAAVVRRAVGPLGSFRSRRRFVGHLTVARLTRRARPARSIGQRFEAEFDVHEIALVDSTLHPAGAVYETIAAWPTIR
jgi:RNA 2',3'-cyclic 3'-phosphodiesterase